MRVESGQFSVGDEGFYKTGPAVKTKTGALSRFTPGWYF